MKEREKMKREKEAHTYRYIYEYLYIYRETRLPVYIDSIYIEREREIISISLG